MFNFWGSSQIGIDSKFKICREILNAGSNPACPIYFLIKLKLMKIIELTQNKVAIVDEEDYEKINVYKWCAIKCKTTWYAARNNYVSKGKQKLLRMHREILNAPLNIQVDHINGNGLDNRKENLRLCTHQQNQHNKKHPQKNNKFKIKGVHYCKNLNKFRARIGFNNKSIHLGYFNVLGDADSAYRIAEEKYFGEFVRKCI